MKYKDVFKEDKADFEETMDSVLLLFAHLSSLDNCFQTKFNNEFEEDLSWKQLLIISYIKMYTEAPTLIEIANRMEISYQNVKKLLLSLEKKGLVEITVDKKDKRKQRVVLTDDCIMLCKKNNVNISNFANNVLSGTTEEQLHTTIDTILRIKCNLRGSSELLITTHEGKTLVAKQFSFKEIYPNKKNRPHFQLYATNGSFPKISGINRWIIGFYKNRDDLNLEMLDIAEAMKRNETEYSVKHYSHVVYDKTGMPLLADA